MKYNQIGVVSNIAQNYLFVHLESHIWLLLVSIHMRNWPKVQLVWVGLKIAQNQSFRLSEVIIIPNSHTKSEIKSSWGRYNIASKSLIWHPGRHYWSLLTSIDMDNWPKVKLGKVRVGSNIVQNHCLGTRKSNLAIIRLPIHIKKWIKCDIRSSWSLF